MKEVIISELVAKIAQLSEENRGDDDKTQLLKLFLCLLDDHDVTFKDKFKEN